MIDKAYISDPHTAAVFANPRQRTILLHLIDQERSPGQLSTLTGSRLNLLHHHLSKLVGLGLVQVSREQRRAGRPVKYYRASAKAFFIPAELATTPFDAGLADELRECLERSRMRSVLGVLYAWKPGGPHIQLIHDADRSLTASELWLELRLSEAEAAALAEQLSALFRPFYGRPADAGVRYIIHAAVARADP